MLNPGTVIAIEGITGIGKSNLGQQLALTMADSGIQSRWYFELEQENPLIPREHYHRIIESSIDRWEEFLASNDHSTQISIVDGRLFLINIVWSLQHGIPSAEIESRLYPLAKLVERNSVAVIYLRTNDLERTFQNTFQRRMCEDWYIGNCKSSNYCKSHDLRGRTSVIEFYREVDRIMARVFGNMDGKSQVVDIGGGEWVSAYRKVFSEFGLDSPTSRSSTIEETRPLVGTYAGEFNSSSAKFVVKYIDGELVLTDHPFTVFKPVEQRWSLMKVDESTFLGKGQPIKLKFLVSNSGKVTGLRHFGMYEQIPRELSDLNHDRLFEKCES